MSRQAAGSALAGQIDQPSGATPILAPPGILPAQGWPRPLGQGQSSKGQEACFPLLGSEAGMSANQVVFRKKFGGSHDRESTPRSYNLSCD